MPDPIDVYSDSKSGKPKIKIRMKSEYAKKAVANTTNKSQFHLKAGWGKAIDSALQLTPDQQVKRFEGIVDGLIKQLGLESSEQFGSGVYGQANKKRLAENLVKAAGVLKGTPNAGQDVLSVVLADIQGAAKEAGAMPKSGAMAKLVQQAVGEGAKESAEKLAGAGLAAGATGAGLNKFSMGTKLLKNAGTIGGIGASIAIPWLAERVISGRTGPQGYADEQRAAARLSVTSADQILQEMADQAMMEQRAQMLLSNNPIATGSAPDPNIQAELSVPGTVIHGYQAPQQGQLSPQDLVALMQSGQVE